MTVDAAIAAPDGIDRLRLALHWKLTPREAWQLRELAGGMPLEAALAAHSGVLKASLRERLRDLPDRETAGAALARLEEQGVRFLDVLDPEFPAILRTIPDPPSHLFVRGPYWTDGAAREGVSPAARRDARRPLHVAVIGARAASGAGKEIARQLGRDLALAGSVVVSGMARGIDGAAHRGALEAGGVTIAVLGAGIDRAYPPEHRDLYEEILSGGGVASEFPPGAPPLPLHFPRRNRILSGLCDAVVLVEGSERSGARSTVDHALDQGREVLAVPRDILHPGSALPNRLLAEGAAVASSARAILEQVGGGLGDTAGPRRGAELSLPNLMSAPGSDLPSEIRNALDAGARGFEDLAAALQATPAELQAALSELEVLGWIQRSPEGRYTARE